MGCTFKRADIILQNAELREQLHVKCKNDVHSAGGRIVKKSFISLTINALKSKHRFYTIQELTMFHCNVLC